MTGVSTVCNRTILLGAAGGTIDVADATAELTISSLGGSGGPIKSGAGNLRISSAGIDLPFVAVTQGILSVSSLTADALRITK